MRARMTCGIGRCSSFSPALLPLLLLNSDGVDELEHLVHHVLRRLDGVVEQDRHVQHKHTDLCCGSVEG